MKKEATTATSIRLPVSDFKKLRKIMAWHKLRDGTPFHSVGRWLPDVIKKEFKSIEKEMKVRAKKRYDEGLEASKEYRRINDACPYPFGSFDERNFSEGFYKGLENVD